MSTNKPKHKCFACDGTGIDASEKTQCQGCKGTGIFTMPSPEEMRARREAAEAEHRPRQPQSGTCTVCSGTAKPVMHSMGPFTMGGPPQRQYLTHYECADCGLLYGRRPGKKEA